MVWRTARVDAAAGQGFPAAGAGDHATGHPCGFKRIRKEVKGNVWNSAMATELRMLGRERRPAERCEVASPDGRKTWGARLVQRVGGSRLALIVAASAIAPMMGTTIARATIPDATNVIHACYADGIGQLRVIDSATSACKNNETPLAWAQAGLAGYEIVIGDTKPVPANNAAFVVAHAACSPGKKLLGGVFHTNNVEVVQNFPQTSGAIAPSTHARGSRAAHHRHAAAARTRPM